MSQDYSIYSTIHATLCALFLAIFTYCVIVPLSKILLIHLVKARLLSRRSEIPFYGEWAVVTGATDGIGRAYAEALAQDGINIILISRTEEKLKKVACEIESTYKVKTKIIQADFTKDDIYSGIAEKLKGLEIGCLVNNVGMSYASPDYFDSASLTEEFFRDMINCNVKSMVSMTKIILPGMVDRSKGGAIINISSASGSFPVPLLSVYSASKAFVDYFSRSLNYELISQNITVQTVLPYFVATNMSKIRRGSFFIPYPHDYVASALSLFGVENRTFGCLSHTLQAFFIDLLPRGLRQLLIWRNLTSIRDRFIKKSKLENKAN